MGKKEHPRIPINGGMQTDGDPGLSASGVCEVVQNLEYIEDGLYGRQPFINDYTYPAQTVQPNSLFKWQDRANNVVRMMAIVSAVSGGRLIVKAADGSETWTQIGSDADVRDLRIGSFASYRGIVYFTQHSAGGSSQLAFYSYDGVTLRSVTPVQGLTPKYVCVFGERVFFAWIRLVVTNLLPFLAVYDPTQWTLTTVNTTKVVTGAVTKWLIAPTAATGSKLELASVFSVATSTTPTKFQVLVMLAGADASFSMPMTISLVFRGQPWVAATVYALGTRRHPTTPNGFVYVVSVAGTSHATIEPTWPTTIGTEVTDNGTLKWKCESVDVIQSENIEVPALSIQTDTTEIYFQGVIPPVVAGYTLMLRYAFGTAAVPSVSLLPVAFSVQDGLADSNPKKRNFGQQVTATPFTYPFVNVDTAPGGANFVATIDLPDEGVWSEPGQPDVVLAEDSVLLLEEPGELTGMIVAGGRLWFFKRRAAWSFLLTEDPNFPIRREKIYTNVGALNDKSIDTLDDWIFCVGENQIYGFNASESPIAPVELLPKNLLRTVMEHGATWAEGYAYETVLRVHPVKRQLWVYTQNFTGPGSTFTNQRIFVFDIDRKRWSYFDVNSTTPTPPGARPQLDFEFNPTTQRMMLVSGLGISREAHRAEVSSIASIAITNSGSGYAGTISVVFPAPTLPGGVQASASATQSGGHINSVTLANAGSGYATPPVGSVVGSGGGSGAVLTTKLLMRDSDHLGVLFDVEHRIRLHPFEMRPDRQVMTVEDVALYGKLTIGDDASTCELDVSFDGGDTFTRYTRVKLTPLSAGAKRRYPIPVRRTGDSIVVDLVHTGATGNDVFNVLDVDANVIVRGPEQPTSRPTPVAKQ